MCEKIQDMAVVTTERQQKLVCDQSNGTISSDFQ